MINARANGSRSQSRPIITKASARTGKMVSNSVRRKRLSKTGNCVKTKLKVANGAVSNKNSKCDNVVANDDVSIAQTNGAPTKEPHGEVEAETCSMGAKRVSVERINGVITRTACRNDQTEEMQVVQKEDLPSKEIEDGSIVQTKDPPLDLETVKDDSVPQNCTNSRPNGALKLTIRLKRCPINNSGCPNNCDPKTCSPECERGTCFKNQEPIYEILSPVNGFVDCCTRRHQKHKKKKQKKSKFERTSKKTHVVRHSTDVQPPTGQIDNWVSSIEKISYSTTSASPAYRVSPRPPFKRMRLKFGNDSVDIRYATKAKKSKGMFVVH